MTLGYAIILDNQNHGSITRPVQGHLACDKKKLSHTSEYRAGCDRTREKRRQYAGFYPI